MLSLTNFNIILLPILLGPLYLHWDVTFHTYQRFFSHLAAVLDHPMHQAELGTNNLIVGSDEEKALVKAVKMSFPQAKLTLCTRHLEKNLKKTTEKQDRNSGKKIKRNCKRNLWT